QFGPSWTQIGKHYLPWRTRVQIQTHYRAKLDLDVKREKWTEDELDLLLRRTIMFRQDWEKVAEGCFKMFWEYWCDKIKEFEWIERERMKNSPEWRTRVARARSVCEWLDQGTRDEFLKLSKLVQDKLEELPKRFPTRVVVHQCNKQGIWSSEDDEQLLALVKKEYGTERWDRITDHLLHRTMRQCAYRWHRVLKLAEENPPAIKNKQINRYRKVMIQNRTPKQCRERWLYSLQTGVTKGRWSHEEEMQLLELVQKTKLQNEKASNGSVWPLIAQELNTGRSDLACRTKYNYMQRKGHRFAFF
ncbi:hypothetical protein BD770DRAFT_399332, partial [Pilaira anomala]